MRPCVATCLLFRCVLIAAGAAARAQSSTTPQAETAARPAASQPAGADDLRAQFEELRSRMAALEARHAQEHEQDQKRIAELEAKLAELQSPAVEAARRDALRAQIAEIRQELANGYPPKTPATSQPAQSGAENELDALLAGAAPPAATADAKPTGLTGSLQSAIQSFNPDISLNGDFLGQTRNHEGRHPMRKFDFRELELGFSGAVDPYTRADVIATVSHEDGEYKADLEEAYLTFLQLPYDLQARAGLFRAEFGRANPIHIHALPWPDYPFVIQRFFGEEGLAGTGGELSWLIPNPWKEYIALTYELVNNDNDSLFAGEKADDVMHVARLKAFHDLNPESTIELGASFATAPNDHGHGSHRSMVEGADITYRYKPKEARLYRSLLWQTEVLAAQADIRGGQESTWGMYSALEYQFARRWKFGVRYDNTQLPFNSSRHEYGYSAYLTFLQSEFLFWRLAYMDIDRNFHDNNVGDEQRVLLQLNFTLGAHPAHKY